jgi:hypothetical protein
MKTLMDKLLTEIRYSHRGHPPLSPKQLEEWQQKNGWRLDEHLLAFYRHFNGALLFHHAERQYRLLPLQEVVRAQVSLFGEDSDLNGTDSWFTICEGMGGKHYAAIDIHQQVDGLYPVFECSHARPPGSPQSRKIAFTFMDFLDRSLHGGRRPYWRSQGWWLHRRPVRTG